jgi:hypothetical protein
VRSIPTGFRVKAGFYSGRSECGDPNGMGRACCRGASCFYFCQLMAHVILLVFLLVSEATNDEDYFKFNWLYR